MKTGKIKSLDLKVYINGGISLDYAPFVSTKYFKLTVAKHILNVIQYAF